jgi:hypothetical protein
MKRFIGTTAAALVVFSISPASAGPVPTWDRVIHKQNRFVVLADFNDEAVLDKETGLVWEKSPSTTLLMDWDAYPTGAVVECYRKAVGGRMGWRLPTEEELFSLVDPTQTSPALPQGHPFAGVQAQMGDSYWSATTSVDNPDYALGVDFEAAPVISRLPKAGGSSFAWCVRGGHGYDAH